MIIDGQGVRLFTARSVAALFVQLLEWLTGGRLVCRGCGMRIYPSLVADFTRNGCACGSEKLSLVGTDGKRLGGLLVAFGGALIAMLILSIVAPIGVDYHIYMRAARAVLAGERLYTEATAGFFYAPWSLAVFIPLLILPWPVGSLLLNTLSVAGLLLSIKILAGKARWWVVIMATFGSIATLNLIASTQWDALILTAVALGYVAIEHDRPNGLGLALAFIGTKPTNAIIPALFLLAIAVSKWRWQAWRVLIIPAVCLAVSFPIAGWDWPIRYFSFIEASPPDAGYNMADLYMLDLPRQLLTLAAWLLAMLATLRTVRRGDDRSALMSGFLLNLLMSPYVTIYHFVTTIPLVVHAAKRDTLWLAGLWLVSMAWMMIQPFTPLYPLALAVTAVFTLEKPEVQDAG